MSERQAIIFALKAIASALSLCDTDMALAMRDRLDAIHEAIDELANDDSAPEKVVNGGAADVTTESCDSREKLEADVLSESASWLHTPYGFRKVRNWLDRQAAITRREVLCSPDERDE